MFSAFVGADKNYFLLVLYIKHALGNEWSYHPACYFHNLLEQACWSFKTRYCAKMFPILCVSRRYHN